MDDAQELKNMIKNCEFADYSTRWKVFVCELKQPLLGSGVQCPILVNFFYKRNEDIPEECPYR